MSRLHGGAVTVARPPVYLDDVVAMALSSTDHQPEQVTIDVPDTLPAVDTDPDLLERALVNVLANSLAWSPSGSPVRIEAAAVVERVHLRIIDRGPGVAPADRGRVSGRSSDSVTAATRPESAWAWRWPGASSRPSGAGSSWTTRPEEV